MHNSQPSVNKLCMCQHCYLCLIGFLETRYFKADQYKVNMFHNEMAGGRDEAHRVEHLCMHGRRMQQCPRTSRQLAGTGMLVWREYSIVFERGSAAWGLAITLEGLGLRVLRRDQTLGEETCGRDGASGIVIRRAGPFLSSFGPFL